jgi:hypothetical protein
LYIIPYSRIGFKSFSGRNLIFLFPTLQQAVASCIPAEKKRPTFVGRF